MSVKRELTVYIKKQEYLYNVLEFIIFLCVNNYVARRYSVVQGYHSEPGLLVVSPIFASNSLKGNFQGILLYQCKPSLRRTEH